MKGKVVIIAVSLAVLAVASVFVLPSKRSEKPGFTIAGVARTGIDFVNRINENDSLNILNFEYIYNGGGVGVADFNNDGLDDIYFSGNQVSSRLYLNKGNMEFADVSREASVSTTDWCTGVSVVDINADGWMDIYVCTASPSPLKRSKNLLFVNQGLTGKNVPIFREMATEYGLADDGYSTQAVFLDYDLDGDLDAYIANNALESYNRNLVRPRLLDGSARSMDRLYRNDGNGKFSDVSSQAGIVVEGWALGVAVSDFNKDGYPDIYVANDFISNDILYINNGDGTFRNAIGQLLKHQSMNSMGVDVADLNNDGRNEIMVVDMLPPGNLRHRTMIGDHNYDQFYSLLRLGYQPQYIRNVLQLNVGSDENGLPRYADIGQYSGVHNTDWSWSVLFFDMDNDGLRDIFVSNGYGKDVTDLDFIKFTYSESMFGDQKSHISRMKEIFGRLSDNKQPNCFFHNTGSLTFSNQSRFWNIDTPTITNGAAYADFDLDGDLDVVVNNLNDPSFIYENHASDGGEAHFLRLFLRSRKGSPSPIGTKVWLYLDTQVQYAEFYPVRGYKSSMENFLHFGTGSRTLVDSVVVLWTDGSRRVYKDVRVDTVMTVEATAPLREMNLKRDSSSPHFQNVGSALNIQWTHVENDFIDFRIQRTLGHQLSREGPAISVADVNGDELEDFFAGAASGSQNALFVQRANGSFEQKEILKRNILEEVVASLFLDYDNDGDEDLYVVTGGTENAGDTALYRDWLYRNNGHGEFFIDEEALPVMESNGSCAVAADFDGDGDLDIFVGGRSVPESYGVPADSYILVNDGKRFVDETAARSPELVDIGMVTAAHASDFNGDGDTDLVIVGEWMNVRFFKNENGLLKDVTDAPAFPQLSGWWNTVVGADFDKDGDTDYIVGNAGLNTPYQASKAKPLSLHVKDFDKNGRVDPVMSGYVGETIYPLHPRDVLIEQIPSLRKKIVRYADYGRTPFEDIFTPAEMRGALNLSVNTLASFYIRNDGNSFQAIQLPAMTQFFPIVGVLVTDVDDDGWDDVVLSGNDCSREVRGGALDAGYGLVLMNDRKGFFNPLGMVETGLVLDLDSRTIARFYHRKLRQVVIIAANNDGPLQFFGKTTASENLVATRNR